MVDSHDGDAERHFKNPDLPPETADTQPPPKVEDEAIQVVSDSPSGLKKKIKAFDQQKRHEDTWSRSPNTTGHGAIHVQTFFAKLTDDSVKYMDQSINEWLDQHPQYEVKFVNSSIGTMRGKGGHQDVMICQVWV